MSITIDSAIYTNDSTITGQVHLARGVASRLHNLRLDLIGRSHRTSLDDNSIDDHPQPFDDPNTFLHLFQTIYSNIDGDDDDVPCPSHLDFNINLPNRLTHNLPSSLRLRDTFLNSLLSIDYYILATALTGNGAHSVRLRSIIPFHFIPADDITTPPPSPVLLPEGATDPPQLDDDWSSTQARIKFQKGLLSSSRAQFAIAVPSVQSFACQDAVPFLVVLSVQSPIQIAKSDRPTALPWPNLSQLKVVLVQSLQSLLHPVLNQDVENVLDATTCPAWDTGMIWSSSGKSKGRWTRSLILAGKFTYEGAPSFRAFDQSLQYYLRLETSLPGHKRPITVNSLPITLRSGLNPLSLKSLSTNSINESSRFLGLELTKVLKSRKRSQSALPSASSSRSHTRSSSPVGGYSSSLSVSL